MIIYYLDASAWVKRYYQEEGTSWVQCLFTHRQVLACSSLGMIEVMATLSRKRKALEINLSQFKLKESAKSSKMEVIDPTEQIDINKI